MTISEAERRAMRRALALAVTPGVPLGPNPRVGCVLLADDGTTIAEGFHRGAGTPHAEADGPGRGGRRRPRCHRRRHPRAVQPHRSHRAVQRGAHRRRRTPGRLRAARRQPGRQRAAPTACGTRASRSSAGRWPTRRSAINRAWSFAIAHRRPFVTWKFATTLDGRSAAADGTSRWVSSRAARLDTHRLRALCDTMLVGTRTVEVDDPELTVRDEVDQPVAVQPLRAVMGLRDLAPDRRVLNDRAETVHLRTRDPAGGAGRAARARPPARVPRGRTRPWPGPSWPRGSSTRSSPTSPRCCSAPAPAPSPTSASPPSPTPSTCTSPT